MPAESANDVAAAGRLAPHPPLDRYYASEEQRRERVDRWFDEAAGDYDWITQAMSFGSGDWYRRRALERAGLRPGMQVLDVGSGTGAVARAARAVVGSGGRVVALDPSLGMLGRALGLGPGRRVRGMAETLPIAGQSFDMLTMGYALRHVADLRGTFAEYRRVLRPGGRVVLLEITAPAGRFARRLLGLYMGGIVPWMARLGRNGRAARELMAYYWDTIDHCVPPAVILEALAAVGLEQVTRHVELGLFSEYTAQR